MSDVKVGDYVILKDGKFGFVTNDLIEIEVVDAEGNSETVSVPVSEVSLIP